MSVTERVSCLGLHSLTTRGCRYYYAIATFDSAATAQHVYDELDGTEMERTANVFDLRFVPDEMDFPAAQGGEEGWRDEAREGDEVGTYRGVDFRTDVSEARPIRTANS